MKTITVKAALLFVSLFVILSAVSCGGTAKFSVENVSVCGMRIGDPTDSRFELTGSGEKAYKIAGSSATYAIDSDGDEIIDTLRVLFKEGEPELMIGKKAMKSLDDFYDVLGEPFIDKETTMQVGDEKSCYAEYIDKEEMISMTVYYYVSVADDSKRISDVLITVIKT